MIDNISVTQTAPRVKLRFELSVYKKLIGKQNLSSMIGAWDTVTMTPSELARWAYRDHSGYCHSVFDAERFEREPQGYATDKANEFFISSEFCTVDIDCVDFTPEQIAAAQLPELLKNPFIARHAFLIVPSSGSHLPDKPKWHIHFAFSEPITDVEQYRHKALAVHAQIGLPTDQATARASQFTAGTYYKSRARHVRGYGQADVYINNYAERVDVTLLPVYVPPEPRQRLIREGETLQYNARKGGRHVKRTWQLLKFILDDLVAKDEVLAYDEYLALRFSAQAGCGQDISVFDLMDKHPYTEKYWAKHREDEAQKRPAERRRWEADPPKRITVGTLYAEAVRRGYGTHNAAEIVNAHVDETLPTDGSYLRRDFTGAGKSEAVYPCVLATLARDERVIWAVPTKTLAAAAYASLRKAGIDAEIYLDDSGDTKSREALAAMRCIVTTPQTLALKIDLAGVGLIVLDEVQQICNAAFDPHSGIWPKREVNLTFRDKIAAYIRTGGIVRGLDAGLAHAAQVWLDLPIYDCTTQKWPKAPVTIFSSMGAMLAQFRRSLRLCKRHGLIYVACDTQKMSRNRANVAQEAGLRVLRIDSDTTDKEAVKAFLLDPDGQAGQYDVIVASPSMLTGVSITARADTVFLFCQFLSPKENLQLLNRFREQGQVYCHCRGMVIGKDVLTPEEAADLACKPVPLSATADLFERVRYWTEVDKLWQALAPRLYLTHLLRREGRTVVYDADTKAEDKIGKDDDGTHAYALDHWHEAGLYRGDYVYRGAVVRRNNHPAIVSDDLFTAAYNLASPITDDGKPNLDYCGRFQRRAPDEYKRTVERPLLEGRLWIAVDGEQQRAGVMYREKRGHYDYIVRRPEAVERAPVWSRDSGIIDGAVKYYLKQRLATTAVRNALSDNVKAQEASRQAELKRLGIEIKAAERRIESMATKIELLSDLALMADLEKRYTATRAEHGQMVARREKLKSNVEFTLRREVLSRIIEWTQPGELPIEGARQLVTLLVKRVEVTDYAAHGAVKAVIFWYDAEATEIDLSRGAVKSWNFSEIQTLKHYASSGASQIILSAALPHRTLAAIRAQLRRLELPKVSMCGIREEETFKAYCKRALDLQISDHDLEIESRGNGEWAVIARDIPTGETVFIDGQGVQLGMQRIEASECRPSRL